MTAAEGHVIHELAGRPALEKLREAIQTLEPARAALVAGRAAPRHRRSTRTSPTTCRATSSSAGWSARTPRTGSVAVGTGVRPGQVVRLHARDAAAPTATSRGARHAPRGARRPHPAGALVFTCNGRGRGMFGIARPRRGRRRARARARPPRASSPPARSARSAASSSCTRSPRPWRSSRARERSGGAPSCSPAPRAGSATRSRARSRRAGATSCSPAAAPRCSSRSPPSSAPARSPSTSPTPPRSSDWPTRPRTSTSSSPTRAAGAAGRSTSFSRSSEIDRALAVNLRAPMVLARAPRPTRWPQRGPAPRLHLVARGQGRDLGRRLSTARRSSDCAASRSGLREDLRAAGVGVSVVSPGFIRDAGMFPDSGAELPPGVGTDARAGRGGGTRAPSSTTAPKSTSRPSRCARARRSRALAPETARLQRKLGGENSRRAWPRQADKR